VLAKADERADIPKAPLLTDSVEKVASLKSPKISRNANDVFDRRWLAL
jgi:hypothetical protein